MPLDGVAFLKSR